MLFSSLLFLFHFLPLTLLVYYFSPSKVKNYTLLFCSLVFFAWGGVSFTIILLGSIVLNYFFGLQIEKNLDTRKGYYWLSAGVTANVVLLAVFKYLNFFVANLNLVFRTTHIPEMDQTNILLPIGISFYTFHALSYLIDIYRRKTLAQKNIFDLALYICMFSQLIAGPIIRYSDVWQQLRTRIHSIPKFGSGVERFLIGLGKKVLLANTFAKVADTMFSKDLALLDGANAWLGLACYTLQIYCDFAGYSDMAIGLGRMFGFEFMENFNFPYIAKSVKEFWRRWHISLSSFFRDYVYIPLGGNRGSETKTYVNLFLVFFLTGFWHGASWSFVAWGLFHGFFMIVEKLGFEKILDKTWRPLANLYTILVVMFAWVLFRAETITQAGAYYQALFRFDSSPEQKAEFFSYLGSDFIICFVVAIAGSLGLFNVIGRQVQSFLTNSSRPAILFSYGYHSVSAVFYAGILFLCVLSLIAGSYNPFIYYRF